MREPSPYFIQRRPAQEPALESDFAPSFFEDEGTKIDLWLYWRLIRKHSRLIAGVTAGAVFVTLIHLLMTTPIYTAQTTVMIQPKAPTGIDPAEALLAIEASYDGSDYFKTQSEILKSRTLAASVVRNLGLDRSPAFTGRGASGTVQLDGGRPASAFARSAERRHRRARTLRARGYSASLPIRSTPILAA